MKGLILKDLYNLGNQWKYILFVAVIFCISFSDSAEGTIAAMFTFISVILLLNSLAQDEADHWYLMAKTLPVTEKQIMAAKYIFAVLLVISGALGGMVLTVIVSMITEGKMSDMEMLGTMTALVSGVILMIEALLIPVNLKFGVQRARYILLGLVIVPVGLGFLAEEFNISLTLPAGLLESEVVLWAGGTVAVILAMMVSFVVSVRIMAKKEF